MIPVPIATSEETARVLAATIVPATVTRKSAPHAPAAYGRRRRESGGDGLQLGSESDEVADLIGDVGVVLEFVGPDRLGDVGQRDAEVLCRRDGAEPGDVRVVESPAPSPSPLRAGATTRPMSS